MFVCERATHGTVASFLKGKPREEIWGPLYSAAQGLQYLHEHGIVHCDLKGDSVLVCDNNLVKLADFGLSVLVGGRVDLGNEVGIGAVRWKAPECLDGPTSTFASDVFSFGMGIGEMVTGELPWGNSTEEAVKNSLRNKKRPSRPNQFSDGEWDLVERMCRFDPDSRISVGALVCLLYELYAGSDSFDAPVEPNTQSQSMEATMLERYKALRRRTSTHGDVGELPKWFIPIYEVQKRNCFAQGSFAKIYSAQWLGADVVLKEVLIDPKEIVLIAREAKLWLALNHENIIQLYGVCHVGRPLFVCEWAAKGALRKFTRGKEKTKIWRYLSDVARGLQYLHSNGVIHGNLKCNTILVCNNGIAKLASFPRSYFAESSYMRKDFTVHRWKTPEELEGGKPTFAVDIYSLGMCVIEAATGEYLWENVPESIVKYIMLQQKRLPTRPDKLNDQEWELVKRMCRFEPDSRIGIDSVVCYMEHFM